MRIIEKQLNEIIPYDNNPRKNQNAVEYVAKSIKEFGFKVPIVIDENNIIVAGHTRIMAAKELGLKSVPCIIADDLTPEKIQAFRLADNKTTEFAQWDFEKLEQELSELSKIDVDMELFGFDMTDEENEVEESNVPEVDLSTEPQTKAGDIYELGKHKLMCSDSTKVENVKNLLGGG